MLYTILFSALLLVSFYFLIKSADYLVLAASILGERAGFSKFIVGLTIVAVGTSLPELASALMGVLTTDNPAPFVLGTVLGSNISNILLISAILLLFSTKFNASIKKEDIAILSISTLLLAFLIFLGQLNYLFGILFIALYITHLVISMKKSDKKDFVEEAKVEEGKASQLSTSFLVWILIISLVVMNLAAKGVVICIENLGQIFEIPLAYLTLTTVALATSLPEAVVTYSSAKKREYDMAIGNIIGSNIANILLIVGLSSLFGTIFFDRSLYLVSTIFLLFSTAYLIWIVKLDKVKPWYGIVSIIFYILYIIMTFIS